ncbi:hypothetical protein SDC9_177524 [bioreactor metagenome]|uniref:Uncharacterized protein n=1 Tax=bioreactor metagenome TaxID=1076179 RepID=A0A645GTB0_9ZZZZ
MESIKLENLRPIPVKLIMATMIPAQAVEEITTTDVLAASSKAAINSFILMPENTAAINSVAITVYMEAFMADICTKTSSTINSSIGTSRIPFDLIISLMLGK